MPLVPVTVGSVYLALLGVCIEIGPDTSHHFALESTGYRRGSTFDYIGVCCPKLVVYIHTIIFSVKFANNLKYYSEMDLSMIENAVFKLNILMR